MGIQIDRGWTSFSCEFLALLLVAANSVWLLVEGASTHSNVTSILEKMLTGYDSRLRPGFGGKMCIIVFAWFCLFRICEEPTWIRFRPEIATSALVGGSPNSTLLVFRIPTQDFIHRCHSHCSGWYEHPKHGADLWSGHGLSSDRLRCAYLPCSEQVCIRVIR